MSKQLSESSLKTLVKQVKTRVNLSRSNFPDQSAVKSILDIYCIHYRSPSDKSIYSVNLVRH